MRRVLLLAVSALALALAAPSGALAHRGHHGHHKHKHHKHHRAHKAKHRFEHVTPAPTGDAGTVASFTDGVLTIALADGSSVSGKVTDRTEIDCTTAEPAPGPTATASHYGDDDEGDDWGHRGCGDDADCDVSDLVPGAIVHEAELRIGSDGAAFKEIELVVQPEPATT